MTQLILAINAVLLAIGAAFKTAVVDRLDEMIQGDPAPPPNPISWLMNVYQVPAAAAGTCMT